jgi:cell division septation protein DedD
MVIACPSCQRKYQIDTSRIPAGGTSFTCWSCRATVRVDPLAASGHEVVAEAASDGPVARPRLNEQASTARTGDSTVPPAAMRFFESLAAEASLNKQMNAPQPALEADAGDAPAPVEPVRHVGQTVDLLAGNDVLDLPAFEPVATSPIDDVLDLDLGIPPAPDAAPAEAPVLEFVPVETPSEPVEAFVGSTQILASAPPEPPADPEAVGEPEPAAAPRPLPTPNRIPLPVQFQGPPTVAAEAPPAEPDVTAPVESPRPWPQRAPVTPPPEVVEPASAIVAASAIPVASQVPPGPAEYAPANHAAWVAPEVERPKGSSRARLGLLALAALVVVGVSAFLVLRFLLRDATPAQPPAARTQPAPQPPATGPTSEKPAAPPAKAETPAPPATTPTPAPAGAGGFTIQVRSSQSEADARAVADSLRAAGFDAYVLRADLGPRGTWYRVRVGRFDSRDEARQTIGKLRASGRASDAILQAYEAP